jgi:hypothetical protein
MAGKTVTKDIPVEARDRIAQFLPKLGSESAGEVAATASAIGRVLQAAGNDWHDLAHAIKFGGEAPKWPTQDEFKRQRDGMSGFYGDVKRSARTQQQGARQDGFAARTSAEHQRNRRAPSNRPSVSRGELKDVIDRIDGSVGGIDSLGERNFNFLQSLLDKCQLYDHVTMTPKQDAWLRSIARSVNVAVPWEEIEDAA